MTSANAYWKLWSWIRTRFWNVHNLTVYGYPVFKWENIKIVYLDCKHIGHTLSCWKSGEQSADGLGSKCFSKRCYIRLAASHKWGFPGLNFGASSLLFGAMSWGVSGTALLACQGKGLSPSTLCCVASPQILCVALGTTTYERHKTIKGLQWWWGA